MAVLRTHARWPRVAANSACEQVEALSRMEPAARNQVLSRFGTAAAPGAPATPAARKGEQRRQQNESYDSATDLAGLDVTPTRENEAPVGDAAAGAADGQLKGDARATAKRHRGRLWGALRELSQLRAALAVANGEPARWMAALSGVSAAHRLVDGVSAAL
jgi:hypothetical protein